MDNEFINLFIQKQKNLITEYQAKLLLVETQFELLQKKHNDLTEDYAKLKNDNEKLQKKSQKTTEPTV